MRPPVKQIRSQLFNIKRISQLEPLIIVKSTLTVTAPSIMQLKLVAYEELNQIFLWKIGWQIVEKLRKYEEMALVTQTMQTQKEIFSNFYRPRQDKIANFYSAFRSCFI